MLKSWIIAFRLRTLPLAFSSIITGTFLAAYRGFFDLNILILTLLTTLFLQVLSNLANDYGDAASGVDSEKREGPSRMVQTGAISKSSMKRAIYICSALSFFAGVNLIYYVFGEQWRLLLSFLLLGLSAIWAAIKYTAGKNPYGYAGFGDAFVLAFFGLVGVGGTYYLYAESFDGLVLLPAVSAGLLAVGVLNVNNVRDISSDAASGKRSIPVRIGKKWASFYHLFLISAAVLSNIVFVMLDKVGGWGFLFLLTLPLLFVNARAVLIKKGMELDPYLKQLAISALLYSLLFGLGLMLPGWI